MHPSFSSLVACFCMPNALVSLQTTALALEMPKDVDAMEKCHQIIYKDLLNGVYKSGINMVLGNEKVAKAASIGVCKCLEYANERLSSRRFLMGNSLTPVDLRLVMNLLRFDAAYLQGFGLQAAQGVLLGNAYPNLKRFIRDIYPSISSTVFWPSFRLYYRWSVGVPASAELPQLPPIIASASTPARSRTSRYVGGALFVILLSLHLATQSAK